MCILRYHGKTLWVTNNGQKCYELDFDKRILKGFA